MLLSIIITNYKNPALLKLCIDSIKRNVESIEYEIIVVDGDTEEDTEMMTREDYPEIKFFSFEKNVGFQALARKGIAESRGRYMLLINGDILVTPGSVQKLLEFIKSNPDVGMIGPKLLNFDGSFQPSCFRFYKPITILYRRTFLGKLSFARKHTDWFLMKDYDHREARDVEWLMGSALLISEGALKKVGPMDKRFFMYMEDVDWCRRFWEKGFRVVYCPDSVMHHYHGKGSAYKGFFYSIFFNKLTWIHIFSALKYFWKYRGKPNPKEIFYQNQTREF